MNVWVALTLKGHVHHAVALEWFRACDRTGAIAFCRQTQAGLLRLLTTRAVMAAHRLPPFSNAEAWKILMNWTAQPAVTYANEPIGLEQKWKRFAAPRSPAPKIWMDAYLAAYAHCSDHRKVTNDKAFRQFKGIDPLILGGS